MRYVTAVNRTDGPLKVTWEGRHHEFAPGKNYMPEQLALAFKYQNPIKGSDDEITGEFQHLVGIVDEPYNDPVDHVDLNDKQIELYNRKHFKNALPVVVVDANGLYQAPRRNPREAALPIDSTGFVDHSK